ncbi:hypothetical protein HN51_067829 [Arachis hypogaea]
MNICIKKAFTFVLDSRCQAEDGGEKSAEACNCVGEGNGRTSVEVSSASSGDKDIGANHVADAEGDVVVPAESAAHLGARLGAKAGHLVAGGGDLDGTDCKARMSVTIHGDDDSNQEKEKEAFALTAASELLIKGTENPSISPVVEMFLDDPTLSSSIHHLNKWFYDENRPLYEITLGKPLWEFLDKNPTNLSLFNDAMASDSQMIKLALKDHHMAFEGLETIVDVGGGTGTTAQIFSEKFPELKYIVFDLPQVVKILKGCNNLSFVGGDMFDSIPKDDAILLKLVLHD